MFVVWLCVAIASYSCIYVATWLIIMGVITFRSILLKLFGCNLICLHGVKENEQSWGKHVNSVCLLVKNDLNCSLHSPLTLYLIYDDEVQITQQYTHGLVIKHRIELSSPYFGIYNYGTVHVNFNMIKISNNRQYCKISDLVFGFDFYTEKNARKSKNPKIDYCKKYLDESVADKRNDTHCKTITSCPAIMCTGLHTTYRLRHFSVSNKFLASFDEEYCTLGEESRSCSSEGFTPIDCSDTSTSQLTTMPITVLLEDTMYRLFSQHMVVFEDSQRRISHHTEVHTLSCSYKFQMIAICTYIGY